MNIGFESAVAWITPILYFGSCEISVNLSECSPGGQITSRCWDKQIMCLGYRYLFICMRQAGSLG